MKRLIHGATRTGKTTKAVQIAIDFDAYLVVHSRDDVRRLFKEFPELRFPITYDELLNNKMRGSFVKKVVLDNVEMFLRTAFPYVDFEAVTCGAPLDKISAIAAINAEKE